MESSNFTILEKDIRSPDFVEENRVKSDSLVGSFIGTRTITKPSFGPTLPKEHVH
jgi:hypothetical protein